MGSPTAEEAPEAKVLAARGPRRRPELALRALADRGYACEAPSASLGPNTRFEAGGVVEVVVSCRLNLSDLDLLSLAPGGTLVEHSVLEPIDRYRSLQ